MLDKSSIEKDRPNRRRPQGIKTKQSTQTVLSADNKQNDKLKIERRAEMSKRSDREKS